MIQIFVSFILCVLFLVVLPGILGLFFEKSFGDSDNYRDFNIIRCLVMGLAFMLAVFQMIAVPMIMIGTRFSILLYAWTVIVLFLAFLSLYIYRGSLWEKLCITCKNMCHEWRRLDKTYILIGILALFLIVFETCLMIFRTHMDTDDARFIAEALEAYEKNSLIRIHPITGQQLNFPIGEMIKEITSPYPIFIAIVSKLTGIHPAIMAHAIFPVLFIPMSYGVIYLIADFWLKDIRKNVIFMFIMTSIVLFSFESMYSWGYTMIAIIWQGRSILAVVVIPLIWYLFFHIMNEPKISKELYISVLVVTLAGMDLSGMGGILIPIIGGVFSLTFLIIKRKLPQAILLGCCFAPAGVYMVLYKVCTLIS